jgi:DNA-binding protein HU-beta
MAGIADVAKKAGIKPEWVTALFDAIRESPERVIIKGFGTFETKTRAGRNGRNPQTGAVIVIPAKTVLTFKAAKQK